MYCIYYFQYLNDDGANLNLFLKFTHEAGPCGVPVPVFCKLVHLALSADTGAMRLENTIRNDGEKIAMRVSTYSIVVNMVLSLGKLLAGILAHSGAMISDAVHSASDVFSTLIVIVGVKLGGKTSDAEHQYGHERLEDVAAILLAVILFLTGAGIGMQGIRTIIAGNYKDLQVPGIMALVAAILSIVTKEWMFWYTKRAADKIHSGALMADAWHHRSDALSSVGALFGIAGARMGYPVLDSVASVVIALFIIKAAYEIFMGSVDRMVDKSCDKEIVDAMFQTAADQEGVLRVDDIRTRMFGSRIYVDIEIGADAMMSLQDAHTVAESVHDAIETQFEQVKHCMVHVNPVVKEP